MTMDRSDPHWFLTTLPPVTRRALEIASTMPLFGSNGWYLAGGTALALQAGHRESIDLDFFTKEQEFPEDALERELFGTGSWHTSMREPGTIYGTFMDAKMSWISYPFFVPAHDPIQYGTIRVLVPADIAVMKIIALSQRGKKRDFIDLYWYGNNREDLKDVLLRVAEQYPGQRHNMTHFIKSFTYFEDAEHEPMPTVHFNASWSTVKDWFKKTAKQIARDILL